MLLLSSSRLLPITIAIVALLLPLSRPSLCHALAPRTTLRAHKTNIHYYFTPVPLSSTRLGAAQETAVATTAAGNNETETSLAPRQQPTSSLASSKPKQQPKSPPFRNILAANRAEIAVRIMRAATEMNSGTVAIYPFEDRYVVRVWSRLLVALVLHVVAHAIGSRLVRLNSRGDASHVYHVRHALV
jgi:hypothetical protein